MSDSDTAQTTTEAVAPRQTMLGQPEGTADHAAAVSAEAGQPQAATDETASPGDDAATPTAESYAAFSLPAGIEIDPQSLTEAKQLFAADGLSQERAQSYVDLYATKL